VDKSVSEYDCVDKQLYRSRRWRYGWVCSLAVAERWPAIHAPLCAAAHCPAV